jgi:hypothetical protein
MFIKLTYNKIKHQFTTLIYKKIQIKIKNLNIISKFLTNRINKSQILKIINLNIQKIMLSN